MSFELTFIFALGLAIGSFLNVVIDRLPNNKSLLGRSHCDFCKKTLQPGDLMPFFSYVWQNGRCRYCKKKLSLQYPLIELLTGLLFIFTWQFFSGQPQEVQILYLIIIATLVAMFFSDLKYQIIPDELQIVLFLVVSRMVWLATNGSLIDFIERFSHAFVVMLPLLMIFLLTRGRGMGFADVKLLFTLGLLFDIKLGLTTIYLAFIAGGIVGTYLLITRKKKRKSMIAFGPFIIFATFVVLFNKELFTRMIEGLLH